jgi:biopolymer transport protein ExbD
MYWNDTLINQAQLNTQLSIAAAQATQPTLQIDAADGTAYDNVARVLAEAKAQGIARIDMLGER